MELNREQELKIFRYVNGNNKTWDNKGERSFINSSSPLHLRQNQGKSKSKFIRHVLDNKITLEELVGEQN